MALKKGVAGRVADSRAIDAGFDAIKVRKSASTFRWHEFLGAGIFLAHVDDRNMRLAFDRLDQEAKGYLSLRELSGVLGSNINPSDFPRAWSPGLRDQIEHITFEDFKMIPSSIDVATE